MISLELARLIPGRILSLTLCVTSSGHGIWRNLPPVRPPLPPTSFPHQEKPLCFIDLNPYCWCCPGSYIASQKGSKRCANSSSSLSRSIG